jgi:galactosamine-6-phosphate isomerase
MEIVSHTASLDLAIFASKWCEQKVTQYQATSMFLPAGQSPIPLYQLWEREHPTFLQKIRLLQIDECLGVSSEQSFEHFLKRELPSFIKQFTFLNRSIESNGLNAVSDFVDRADLCVLGLGLNGHIAFHEPDIDPSLTLGCVKLSESTCERLQLERGSWGLSYGSASFLQCKAILLIVRGEGKKESFERLLKGDPRLPASRLLNHPDLCILSQLGH